MCWPQTIFISCNLKTAHFDKYDVIMTIIDIEYDDNSVSVRRM